MTNMKICDFFHKNKKIIIIVLVVILIISISLELNMNKTKDTNNIFIIKDKSDKKANNNIGDKSDKEKNNNIGDKSDKEKNNNIDNKNENNNTDNLDEEKLDVNSELVQKLYKKVSNAELNKKDSACHLNYMYYGYKDFYVSKATESDKMKIIGRILDLNKRSQYNGDRSLIPDTLSNYIDYESVFSRNNKKNENNVEYYYEKSYIEELYKDVFGSNEELDTNAGIMYSPSDPGLYIYIPTIDKYVLYVTYGGGSCNPNSYYTTLQKAIKKDSKLEIYENTTEFYGDEKVLEVQYLYTFVLENNGEYSFYSRIEKS